LVTETRRRFSNADSYVPDATEADLDDIIGRGNDVALVYATYALSAKHYFGPARYLVENPTFVLGQGTVGPTGDSGNEQPLGL
jgi:hypothetical protein